MSDRKLTVEQANQVRQQYAYGRRTSAIAEEFGISRQLIWKIVSGLSYKENSNKTSTVQELTSDKKRLQ